MSPCWSFGFGIVAEEDDRDMTAADWYELLLGRGGGCFHGLLLVVLCYFLQFRCVSVVIRCFYNSRIWVGRCTGTVVFMEDGGVATRDVVVHAC